MTPTFTGMAHDYDYYYFADSGTNFALHCYFFTTWINFFKKLGQFERRSVSSVYQSPGIGFLVILKESNES